MNIIQPKVEYKGLGNFKGSKHAIRLIEAAARTCYRSEMADTYEKALSFVRGLAQKGHTSVLAHVQITYLVPSEVFDTFWSFVTKVGKYRWYDILLGDDNSVYISGCLRVWYETIKLAKEQHLPLVEPLYRLVNIDFPAMFDFAKSLPKYACQKEACWLVPVDDLPTDLLRLVFHVVTDRAVTMEWDRHTTLGVSEESQRYCKYESLGLDVVCPPELAGTECEDEWKRAVETSETIYKHLRERGVHQQIARSVLPNCTVVRSYFSGIVPFWKHFCNVRTAKSAHPHIRVLAEQVAIQLRQLIK